jgi:hypothetical protein
MEQAMSECQSPCELVSSGWQLSQSYASDAFHTANNFFNSLGPAMADIAHIPHVNLNIAYPQPAFGPIQLPNPPTAPDLTFHSPAEPGELALDPVAPINPPSAPQFLAKFPDIRLPSKPQPLSATAPGDPPAVATIAMPVKPDIVIPSVPTLRELSLPDAPTLSVISFLEDKPSSAIAIPNGTFNYTEPTYQSGLLDAIKTKLSGDIQNGRLGIPTAVEVAIWDRARAREEANVERLRYEALEGFAARGFSLPAGVLAARLDQAEQEAVNLDSSLSRDIAIKQAEMTLQHLQFCLTTGVQLEGVLLNYSSQVAERAFNVARAMLDASIAIFTAQVQKLQVDVSAYEVYANVFKTRLEGELTKLEQYKAELEARKIIGDLNLQDLEAFKAQIGAIAQIAQLYTTEISAVREQVSLESLKLEQHKTKVETFTALTAAKAQEYSAYAKEIEGELAKVSLFDSQAKAYDSQIQGYRGMLQALSIKNESDIATNKAKIDIFTARLQAFQAKLTAEGERFRASATAYGAGVQAYSAQISGEQVKTQSEQETLRIQSANADRQMQLQLQEAITEIDRATKAASLLIESLKAGAGVASQLAASSLSAVNLSGSIGGTSATNTTYSYSL